PIAPISSRKARSFGRAYRRVSRPTRRLEEFTSASLSTSISPEPREILSTSTHGTRTKTPPQTLSEADHDAFAAAGDQAAAVVEARAPGSAQPGAARESAARRDGRRGEDGDPGEGERLLRRDRLRRLLPGLHRVRLQPADDRGTRRVPDREHAHAAAESD